MMAKMLSVCLLIVLILLSACGPAPVQTVEVTRVVPQTAEVTRIIQQTVEVTSAPTLGLPSLITSTPAPQDNSRGLSVNGAEMTIIQYYTLLNYHLFREAYELMYTKPVNSLDYLNWYSMNYRTKSVTILRLVPYSEITKGQEFPTWVDTDTIKAFRLEFIPIGEDPMVGSTMSGNVQGIYIKMTLVDGKWKYLVSGTSPF